MVRGYAVATQDSSSPPPSPRPPFVPARIPAPSGNPTQHGRNLFRPSSLLSLSSSVLLFLPSFLLRNTSFPLALASSLSLSLSRPLRSSVGLLPHVSTTVDITVARGTKRAREKGRRNEASGEKDRWINRRSERWRKGWYEGRGNVKGREREERCTRACA